MQYRRQGLEDKLRRVKRDLVSSGEGFRVKSVGRIEEGRARMAHDKGGDN